MRQEGYDQLLKGGHFSSALLVVREHLPSRKACLRLNIDATRIGNVARFINHSCDGGNLSTVLIRSTGAFLPRLCFFSSRDIGQDEELSFSYGEMRVRPDSEGSPCFCGASSCSGTLPSEHTWSKVSFPLHLTYIFQWLTPERLFHARQWLRENVLSYLPHFLRHVFHIWCKMNGLSSAVQETTNRARPIPLQNRGYYG